MANDWTAGINFPTNMLYSEVLNIVGTWFYDKNLLEKAILHIYDGRDERFKYNNLTNSFSEPKMAKETAEKLAERILS